MIVKITTPPEQDADARPSRVAVHAACLLGSYYGE